MEEKRAPQGYSSWGQGPKEGVSGPDRILEASDEELIRLGQQGDTRAVSVLYMRYRKKVLNYTYRLTGNRAAAEEVTQETFLRVVKHLARYRPTGSAAGWIFRIAKNLALNRLRWVKGAREVSLEEHLPGQGEAGGGELERGETVASSGPGPAEEAQVHEMERRVQEALLEVNPNFREVLILCDIQGYGYKEAAELLQCSINTVASRLARGRLKLARLLGFLKGEL